MAAGLLAVVAWEVKPTWLFNNPGGAEKTAREPESAQAQTPAPPPPSTPAPVSTPAPTEPAAEPPAGKKPSPMPAAADAGTPPSAGEKAAPEEAASAPAKAAPHGAAPAETPAAPAKTAPHTEAPPRRPPATRAIANPQPLSVSSSPKGAVVTMDNQPDTACTTPCTFEATPGHHTLDFVKAGYDLEHREVEVGSSAVEVPAVVMRSVRGTLMLTSTPPGAAVLVNGTRQSQLTPAQIALAPGSYTITVEWKDGKKATRTVQIKDTITYEKFVMEQ